MTAATPSPRDRAAVLHETPVGHREVAGVLNVDETTVYKWIQRGLLPAPEPNWVVSGRPAWRLLDILVWAVHTGRRTRDQLDTIGLDGILDTHCERCLHGIGQHRSSCTTPKVAKA